jgi:hypothetical protein
LLCKVYGSSLSSWWAHVHSDKYYAQLVDSCNMQEHNI